MQKSFTLIELIVVIAIIGLLASVILVSMSGVQSKAKIAKTLEFSQSIQHALGAYAVGIWNFDEGSGTAALDGSGYGNNGTINGAVYTSETPHAIAGSGTGKYALNFDGVDDYVSVSTQGISTEITVEMWLKRNDTDSRTVFGGYTGNIFAAFNQENWQGAYGTWLRLGVIPCDSRFANITSYVAPGNFVHFVASYSKNKELKAYLNGVLVGTLTDTCDITSNNLLIGKQGGWPNFNGIIDEVRIYEIALTLGQIQKLYAEGAGRHQGLTIK